MFVFVLAFGCATVEVEQNINPVEDQILQKGTKLLYTLLSLANLALLKISN